MLISCLNQITPKEMTNEGYTRQKCERCGTGAEVTIEHRWYACPCNVEEQNALDDKVAEHTGYQADTENKGPAPTILNKILDKYHTQITTLLTSEQNEHSPARVDRTITFPVTPQRQRTVKLDTLQDIKTYSLLYTLNSHTTQHSGPYKKPHGASPNEGGPAIKNHITFLVNDMGSHSPRTQSPTLRLISRHFLRTYSDLYLNPLTARAPWDATWRSRHNEGWRVGGIQADTQNFLLDRYTWISMRPEQKSQMDDLKAAVQAIQASTRPARAVLLLRNTTETRNYMMTKAKGVIQYILITIDSNTAPILLQDEHCYNKEDASSLYSPKHEIILTVIENNEAPDYDVSLIRQAVASYKGITVHNLDHKTNHPSKPIPEEMNTQNWNIYQHHPLLRPSQTWYRTTHTYAVQEQRQEEKKEEEIYKPTNNDKMHPALALLGELPKTTNKHIVSHMEDANIGKETMEKISNTIMNKTLLLLKKDESFRKWRKKP